MRIKESLQLDSTIRDRAASLPLEPNHSRFIKKSKVLAALIECQEKLDEIMRDADFGEKPRTTIGDINVTLNGDGGKGRGGANSNAPFRPFDGGDVARQVARQLKKELRKV
jgi:hypothetical protein